MKPLHIRDIIGPIMVGPSSSHTAGALRIASMARRLFRRKPVSVEFILYGSFAQTYIGHGTDRALCAGILGMEASDLRIRDSLQLAKDSDIAVTFTPRPDAEYNHPNTVDVIMSGNGEETMRVRGESIGGGSAIIRSIDDIDIYITGECTSIVIRQYDAKGVLAHIATCISDYDINIASTRMYRERKGELAYTILETDEVPPLGLKEAIKTHPAVLEVRIIPADSFEEGVEVESPREEDYKAFEDLDFSSGETMLAYCEEQHCSISAAFAAREEALAKTVGRVSDHDLYLSEVLEVMKASALEPASVDLDSMGGLIGGESKKIASFRSTEEGICDSQLSLMTQYALAVLETNASMGRIVAAPTAGSSGVIPAVLLCLQETRGFDDEALKRALITSSAIGYLITRNATVSGAEGGCQAEIGSAAAMAAAAAVELAGGSPAACFAAAANALTNMMGLVCDPIGGLVEVPCQKRNASGAANAFISAEIALAGITNLVDFDQTVEAMYKVGRSLPFELRETALGGIAAAPSACDYCGGCKN